MARALLCPRDGSAANLERHPGGLGEFVLDVCPKCGGAWFDHGEVSKLTGDREIEKLIIDYAGGASEFACPRCGRSMARRPVGEVTVDVCPNCEGIWMDRGELETAARTLGGVVPEASTLDFGRSLHARDLATLTLMSPRTREALLASAVERSQRRFQP